MSQKRASSLTDRDRRLLVGFGFFAELFLGYFLLIDPAMGRVARLDRDIAAAKTARDALAATAPAALDPTAPAGKEPLPPPLPAEGEEAAALTVQRHVAELSQRAGVTPVGVTVDDKADDLPTGQRRVTVTVVGGYEAIERFVGRLAWPDAREGVERLDLKPEGPRSDRVVADARLLVELSDKSDK